MADNQLGPAGAKILADMLNVSSSMTKLNLTYNNLGGKIESGYIRGKSWAEGEVVEHEGFTWTCTTSYDWGKKLTRYDRTGVKAIAAALIVSSSMKKLIIFKNRLGDEGIRIITSAVEGKEISLCGAEPGQTDLDLSKQGLRLDDAKIIAWELSAGFFSSSMNSLK